MGLLDKLKNAADQAAENAKARMEIAKQQMEALQKTKSPQQSATTNEDQDDATPPDDEAAEASSKHTIEGQRRSDFDDLTETVDAMTSSMIGAFTRPFKRSAKGDDTLSDDGQDEKTTEDATGSVSETDNDEIATKGVSPEEAMLNVAEFVLDSECQTRKYTKKGIDVPTLLTDINDYLSTVFQAPEIAEHNDGDVWVVVANAISIVLKGDSDQLLIKVYVAEFETANTLSTKMQAGMWFVAGCLTGGLIGVGAMALGWMSLANVKSKNRQPSESARQAEYEIMNHIDSVLVPNQQTHIAHQQTQAAEPKQGTTDDVLEQLGKLAELRDKGVLTDDEFAKKKTELLDRI